MLQFILFPTNVYFLRVFKKIFRGVFPFPATWYVQTDCLIRCHSGFPANSMFFQTATSALWVPISATQFSLWLFPGYYDTTKNPLFPLKADAPDFLLSKHACCDLMLLGSCSFLAASLPFPSSQLVICTWVLESLKVFSQCMAAQVPPMFLIGLGDRKIVSQVNIDFFGVGIVEL